MYSGNHRGFLLPSDLRGNAKSPVDRIDLNDKPLNSLNYAD